MEAEEAVNSFDDYRADSERIEDALNHAVRNLFVVLAAIRGESTGTDEPQPCGGGGRPPARAQARRAAATSGKVIHSGISPPEASRARSSVPLTVRVVAPGGTSSPGT